MIKSYFVSDIHLKSVEESNSEKLLLFLHSLKTKQRSCTHLFLVGDIFDLWIHNHQFFVDKYSKIENAISSVISEGIEVHYFEGNHDIHLVKFWQQEVGVKVHDGPAFFNLGQYKIRVEHGDFMNPDDKAYLFLRKFLRNQPMKFISENLPGGFVQWFGNKASQASREYTSNQKAIHENQSKDYMHCYALKVIEEGFFDYLVTGHTHVRDVFNFQHQSKSVHSINLGSWFEQPQALLIDENGHRFEII
jgi:UDP-2,3-diacylglucosamine hydrolase